MKKTGIFYGSTTGNTESVAQKIATHLNIAKENIHNVANTKPDAVLPYDVLILGCSTWGASELQDDWNDFLFKLKDLDLKGKTVAIFGCGDGIGFGNNFCDALGLIYSELQRSGCSFIGKVKTDGYHFEDSMAVIDNQFVGLPIDENNESEKTDDRVKAWTEQLKAKG